MTTDTQNTHTWLPAAAILFLATAVGTALYLGRPLESRRQAEPSVPLQTPLHEELVLARLWQDPLHAIQTHWNGIFSRDPSLGSLYGSHLPPTVTAFARRLASAKDRSRNTSDLLLAVMMPDTPYTNDREGRRRQRHAVVSALTQTEGPLARFLDFTLVGYERYQAGIELDRAAHSAWDSILLLWLNAGDFGTYPIHQVAALFTALQDNPSDEMKPITVLLGPVGSGARPGHSRPCWTSLPGKCPTWLVTS